MAMPSRSPPAYHSTTQQTPRKRRKSDELTALPENLWRRRGSRELSEEEEQTAYDRDLVLQLSQLGLQLRDVPGDGNCLFRALGDQLEGTQMNHMNHRQRTVDYMIEERSDFEPFVDDDCTFEEYVNDLRTDGTYAGNDAIVAFARNNRCDIVIHQLHSPLWTIRGGKRGRDRPQLHIAYLNGDHYASVRKLHDETDMPAEVLVKNDRRESLKKTLKHEIRRVRKATGIKDEKYIRKALKTHDYNVEYTIFVLQQSYKSEERVQNTEDSEDSEEPSNDKVVGRLGRKNGREQDQGKAENRTATLKGRNSNQMSKKSERRTHRSAVVDLFLKKLRAIKF